MPMMLSFQIAIQPWNVLPNLMLAKDAHYTVI